MVYRFYITLLSLFSPYIYISIAAFRVHPLIPYQDVLVWIIEGSFLLNIVITFLVDYKDEGDPIPVRDFNKIANRYLYGDFALDIFTLIPF